MSKWVCILVKSGVLTLPGSVGAPRRVVLPVSLRVHLLLLTSSAQRRYDNRWLPGTLLIQDVLQSFQSASSSRWDLKMPLFLSGPRDHRRTNMATSGDGSGLSSGLPGDESNYRLCKHALI